MMPLGMMIWRPLLQSQRKRRYIRTYVFLYCMLTVFLLQGNIFDTLPALSAPKLSELRDELDSYLSTDPEHIIDALAWWVGKHATYPHLSRMALNYLSIPGRWNLQHSFVLLTRYLSATSVDVKCIFSCGWLLLSHVCSRLSVQSTRALLCLGCWSTLGLVQDKDIEAVTRLADVEGDEEQPLDDDWDHINM